MKNLLRAYFLLFAVFVVNSCATKNEKAAPTAQDAQNVLGMTKAEVIKELGAPADKRGEVYYWNLSRSAVEHKWYMQIPAEIGDPGYRTRNMGRDNWDSGNVYELYEFYFQNDRLVRVRPAQK